MSFKLVKTNTFVHACELTQLQEDGKKLESKLRVRFNKITRAKWDAMTKADDEDDRILFDVLVNKIEDDLVDDSGDKITAEDAVTAIREDLSLTGQIVEQGLEIMFGAAAKNARRSRGR